MASGARVRRRPLVGCLLAVLTGTFCGLRFPVVPVWLLLGVALLSAVAARGARRAGWRESGTCFACLTVVALVTWAYGAVRGADPGRAWLLDPLAAGTRARVCGRVVSDPEIAAWRPGTDRWRFSIRVESLELQGGLGVAYAGDLPVSWFADAGAEGPLYGTRWRFRGRLYEQKGFPGWRPPPRLVTGETRAERVPCGGLDRFAAGCYAVRRYGFRALGRGVEGHALELGIIRALVLGARPEVDRDVQRLLRQTGTVHILAVSGLHVGMVALLITFTLGAAGLSREHWFYVLCPVLIGYTVATGARASAVRACMMALVYFAAPIFSRRPDGLSSVCLAAIAILLFSPSDLFDMGFCYTFIVVAGLIVIFPLLYRRFMGRLAESAPEADRLPDGVEADLDDPSPFVRGWRAGRRAVARRMGSLILLSVTAWVVSVPLTAHWFGRFTPVALVANVAVIPLTFLIVLTGFLSLTTGGLMPWCGEIFNHANVMLARWLIDLMELLARAPFGHIRVPEPPVWMLALWYAALGIGVLFLQQPALDKTGESR